MADLFSKFEEGLEKYSMEVSGIFTHRLKVVSRLCEISSKLISTLAIEKRLDLVIRLTKELMESTVISLLLIDKKTGILEIKAAYGLEDKVMNKAVLRKDSIVADWVITHKKPLLVTDVDRDRRLKRPAHPRYRSKTFLSVPIILNGDVIGIINNTDKVRGGVYTQEDLEVVNIIANMASSAIQNSWLFAELKKRHAELSRLDRAKTDFITIASHELRTPLTAIKEGVSLMLEGITGRLAPKQLKYLVIIKRNIDRLSNLMNDLLDMSRLESGVEEFKWERVNLREFFEEVKGDFRIQTDVAGITIKTSLPAKKNTVLCDRRMTKRVLENLVHNAIKYTPAGGRVTLKAVPSDREMQISVSDTGCGIPKEYQGKIFDKFYKLEKPGGQESRGAGLGLSIAKGLVEAQCGRIWVESPAEKGGKGSAFTFTIPCHKKGGRIERGRG